MRWAQLTAEMNGSGVQGLGHYLPLLLAQPGDERDTVEARRLLTSANGVVECVRTGRPLAGVFHIDHAVPYRVWGNNDLWNLLPALPQVNTSKRDRLPSRALLLQRRERIIGTWQQ